MDTKKLEEFTQKVKAGDITDFEPWFDEKDQETLQTLKQICIRYGVYQEAYIDWALDDHDPWIQQMLASNGNCLDSLIYAEDGYVREVVLKKELRYALEPNVMGANLGIILALLMSTPEPDKDVLDAFIQTGDEFKNGYDGEALRQKHAAYKIIPTTIEKTMSPSQLFQSQSPFWATDLTLERIEAVLDVYDTVKSDVFFEYLKSLIEANEYYFYTLVWDLKLNHRKET